MKSRILISCLFILGMTFASVGRNNLSKQAFDKDVGLSKIIKTEVEQINIVALPTTLNYENSVTVVIYPVIVEPSINYLSVSIKEKIYLINCSILQFTYGTVAAV